MIQKVLQFFNLESDLDSFENIHKSIEKDVVFKGMNLWILVIAIFVASVGLNMNSTAVIIGAMLISPLMGPINGMGYAIAVYDFALFRKALKNFTFAVIVSLITSTIYFALSPISTAHSELLARTTPTIYDVLIALFGGLAGIVAISCNSKGNVVTGVAIATALMPPLCTAGYGLASGQFAFFFGAFYLFTINTVFIALASVGMSQILKFPIRIDIGETKRRQVNHIVTGVILVTLLPSIYFGYGLVKQERFNQNASQFVQSLSIYEGNFLLKSDIRPNKRSIELIFGGGELNEKQKAGIAERAIMFNLEDAKLYIDQGLSFDRGEEDKATDALRDEISRLNQIIRAQESSLSTISARQALGKQLLAEMQPLFPGVEACTMGEGMKYQVASDSILNTGLFYIELNKAMPKKDQQKLQQWIQLRSGLENAEVFFKVN